MKCITGTLKSGYLAGAALDALIQAPPDQSQSCCHFPTLSLLRIWGPNEALSIKWVMAMQDCLAVLQGNPLLIPYKTFYLRINGQTTVLAESRISVWFRSSGGRPQI